MRHHELNDEEWAVIAPLLSTNSRGVERVDDYPVINGVLWRFRTGSLWPVHHAVTIAFLAGAKQVCGKRYECDIVMIGSSCVRIHQLGANAKKVHCRSLHGTFACRPDTHSSMLMACWFGWN